LTEFKKKNVSAVLSVQIADD